jgi:hypothetical protein
MGTIDEGQERAQESAGGQRDSERRRSCICDYRKRAEPSADLGSGIETDAEDRPNLLSEDHSCLTSPRPAQCLKSLEERWNTEREARELKHPLLRVR